MFTGHYGAALLVAGLVPRSVPLWLLFILAQFQDLMRTLLLYVVKVETCRVNTDGENAVMPIDLIYVPYSHGLFPTLLYAVVLPLCLVSSKHARSAAAAAILSHWILDWIVHMKDLDVCFPFADCPKAGLQLWRYLMPSVIAECGVIVVGTVVYLSSIKERGVRAKVLRLLLPLVAFMLFVTATFPFAPPPEKLDESIAAQFFSIYGILTLIAWAIERPLREAEDKRD